MLQPTMMLFMLLFFPCKVICQRTNPSDGEFILNGNLLTIGSANLNNNGFYTLTNSTPRTAGQIFHNPPIRFKDSVNGTVYSFSTTFVFAIKFHNGSLGGYGLAFVICPTRGLPLTFPLNYIGLFNKSNMEDPKNHLVAIELDITYNQDLEDIDANHVGIDINSLVSEIAFPAGYFEDDASFRNLSLSSGVPMQIWIEYDSKQKQLNVTLYPIHTPKPKIPLLSLQKDLSPYLLEHMYIGFVSTTGVLTASHYVLGWTFKMNGIAPNIDLSRLPKLPSFARQPWIQTLYGVLIMTLLCITILIFLSIGLWLLLKRKKLLEVLEDWELQYGPYRFAYKDLHTATKGFKDTELLGKGGFGKVFKGTLPVSNTEIAVKRVSHDSKQGLREFIAEIATIGRLRHPNLVRLQGYCRQNNELYLVYDCMPKGSLDKFLYHQVMDSTLNWSKRFNIIKDIASGLCYLHEQWVQSIIHRDIKPANILLDGSMNAKLGDFGLAKLCDHGIDPQTSHVAGTFGYISPELSRTGKASTSSDVFALGVVMLEITCGRKPILPRSSPSEMVLTDWVLECWENGDIMQVLDHKIKHEYLEWQVTLVLKLGLLCAHPIASIRPSMSSVIQILDNVAQLPHNLLDIMKAREIKEPSTKIFGKVTDSHRASDSIAWLTFTESFVSHGR